MAEWVAQAPVWARRFSTAFLTALDARPAAALLVTPMLQLSKDPSAVINADSLQAALVAGEADFSGYTAGGVAVVLSAAVRLGTGAVGRLMNEVFIRTLGTPDIGNIVTAWWISDTGGFVCGELLPAGGIHLDLPGDFLDLLAVLPMGFAPVYQP